MGARRGRGRADRPPRGRGRHHLLRHRRRLQRRRRARCITGRLLAQALRHARGVRRRDEGARPDDARRERARALAQAHPGVDRRVARAARARLRRPVPDPPLGLRARRSRRRWRRCTTSCARARRATSARAACTRGSSRRRRPWRRARLDAVRLDAEPLQPGLPRGGAGDDPAVHRPGRRRSCRGARSRAGCSPATARARASGSRRAPRPTRSATSLYKPEVDFAVVDRVAEVAAERGVPPAQVALAWLLHKPGVTAPIVGATKLAAPRGRARGRAARAQRRGDRAARGAVRPARRLGAQLECPG